MAANSDRNEPILKGVWGILDRFALYNQVYFSCLLYKKMLRYSHLGSFITGLKGTSFILLLIF